MIRKLIFTFGWGFSLLVVTTWGQIAHGFPLREISLEKLRFVGLDDKLGNNETDFIQKTVYPCQTNPRCPNTKASTSLSGWNESQRQALLTAVEHSLDYLSTPKAIAMFY